MTRTRRRHPSLLSALALLVAVGLPPAAGGQQCAADCAGNCDGDAAVTVDELLRAVAIALERRPVTDCAAADRDADRRVTADELVGAVRVALDGCDAPVATSPPLLPLPGDLAERPLPAWFADAKLGIMIHWGPFTIPAWAERTLDPEVIFTDPDDPNYFFSIPGVEAFLQQNPYSEWYWNSSAIPGSAAAAHHRDTWGADFPYEAFAPRFEAELETFYADAWARRFQQAGARYVVLVTKHHDGYTLWPSAVAHPERGTTWQAERDLVGELTDASRRRCLRMGLYYSGGIDWTWTPPPFATFLDALQLGPPQPEYAVYADDHWRELIARYRPSVLWNDIGAPATQDVERLFRDYYAAVPDGVVNDRWTGGPTAPHRDYRTAEFTVEADISPAPWEAVRGMSRGFGYNQNETEADYGPPEKFVHLLADIVAKNGNLLLNVGPRADGSIPEPQERILATLGAWLADNGAAIYGTRPWQRFGADTDRDVSVRFTAAPDGRTVYAILLGTPPPGPLTIAGFDAAATAVRLLAGDVALEWSRDAAGLRVTLPPLATADHAHVLAIALAE